ncbi:MAG: AMIN domain-containing protein [Terriglobales bacterium]
MFRVSTALFWVLIGLNVAALFAQPTQNVPPAANSKTAARVGNIEVHSRSDGLSIAIAVSGDVVPSSSRASNPDRLIFDFPGCELKGATRHIPVNRGPVKDLRVSLFRAHPPATRVVVDSTQTLNFELKSSGNGRVVIEIPFSNAEHALPPSTSVKGKNQAASTALLPIQPPVVNQQRSKQPPGAYAFMDKAKALTLEDLQSLEDKARSGDPEAQTMLALAYHAGVLLKKDDDEASRLLHKAADRKYMAAEESLGIFAETGIAMDHPAPTEALAWYKQAAQQGSVDAETDIALLYANGKGVTRDPRQAVSWFRRAAEGGDASAQYNLALMYERGEGVAPDFKEAIRWHTAAADQNLIPPLLALGEIFLQPPNSSIQTDVNKAIQYYERAANLGSASAEVTLGTIYSKGLPGKVDYDKAAEWYRKAAEKGDPDGEFALGVSCATGHGVPVDYALARQWLTAAANQGQIEAQYDLGIMCEQGNGAPPDRELAAHYYQMAAERGMAKAQYRYGLLLAKGTSTSDKIAAYKWLTLSQDAIKESSPALNDLRKEMSPQEIAQAEQDLAGWRSAHSLNKR